MMIFKWDKLNFSYSPLGELISPLGETFFFKWHKLNFFIFTIRWNYFTTWRNTFTYRWNLSPHGEKFQNLYLSLFYKYLCFFLFRTTIGLGFNTPLSLFHLMEEEVCFFHFKVKKTCLCDNFSPAGEKSSHFQVFFTSKWKKSDLGKIVKNHLNSHKDPGILNPRIEDPES